MGIDQLSTQPTVNPDTVGEIPENNATIEVSDGTDDYNDGDMVVAANWNGTPVAALLGNVNDGTGLVSVDTGVSGDLGGLL